MEFDINKDKIQIEKDGKIVDCDIYLTFDIEELSRSYIVYTDHSIGSNGAKNLYYGFIDMLNPDLGLQEVTEEKEINTIKHVLEENGVNFG